MTDAPIDKSGLRHGPLTSDMVPLLTAGSSVLFYDGHPLPFVRRNVSGEPILDFAGWHRPVSVGACTYIGERGPDGWITAPEGGWTGNPVPGMQVLVRSQPWVSIVEVERPSDGVVWQDIIAFRPIEAQPPVADGGGDAREKVYKLIFDAVLSASVDVPDKFEERVAMRETISKNLTNSVLAALSAQPAAHGGKCSACKGTRGVYESDDTGYIECPVCAAPSSEGAPVEVEWSYHDDDLYPPRPFWHLRLNSGEWTTGWRSRGKQEQSELTDAEKAEAVADLMDAAGLPPHLAHPPQQRPDERLAVAVEALRAADASFGEIVTQDIHHEGFDIDSGDMPKAGETSRTWIGDFGIIARSARVRVAEALRLTTGEAQALRSTTGSGV